MRRQEALMVTSFKFLTWDQVDVDDGSIEVVLENGGTTVTITTKFGKANELERLPWTIGDIVHVDWETGSIQ